jgi:hypothetical protein
LQGLFKFVPLSQAPPQEGIDESSLAGKSKALGQFNGFVYRGMVWDAIEEEHLIKTNPQQVAQNEGLRPIVSSPGNEPIEKRLLADGPERQFVQERAILRGKTGLLAGRGQFLIKPRPGFRPAA